MELSHGVEATPSQPFVGCTAIARRQLAHARVLVKSFRRHYPEGRFYVICVDGVPETCVTGMDATVLSLSDLLTPDFTNLACTFELEELVASVKPALVSLILDRFQEESVVYFDPEDVIFRRLDELSLALGTANIVLIPRILRPLPHRDRKPADRDILILGAYSGFGVRDSAQARTFLSWWEKHVLIGEGVVTGEGPVYYPRGIETPGKWLDLVPTLFSEAALLRDDTYNVAWWNLHHRLIGGDRAEYRVNGRPIATFHFEAFDPLHPRGLTTSFQNREEVTAGSPLAALLESYANDLLRNDFLAVSQALTDHRSVENGIFGHQLLRQLYMSGTEADRMELSKSGDVGDIPKLVAWATEFPTDGAGLSPFLRFVYRLRADLASAFPDVEGKDRAAYLAWAQAHGSRELGFHPSLALPGAAGLFTPCANQTPHQLIGDIKEIVNAVIPADAKIAATKTALPGLSQHLGRDVTELMADCGTDETSSLHESDRLRAQGNRFLLVSKTPGDNGTMECVLRKRYRIAVEHSACTVYDLSGARCGRVGRLADVPRYSPCPLAGVQTIRPECSIIIPVHGKAALTRQCLKVLLTPPYEKSDYEIIVVDDASPDDTCNVLAEFGNRIRVVSHDRNEGFARTCNDGAVVASGEYLVFLNNDTIPQPGWLDALVRYKKNGPKVGAVGSKLLYPNDTVQHAGTVILQDRWPRHVYVGFPANHPAVNKSRRFQAVTAASMLISRQWFEELGGFDTSFRNSYEDVDLCLRMNERGAEVHYCHESVLYHLESVSRAQRVDEDERNARTYFARWGHRVQPDDLQYYFEDNLLTVDRSTAPPRLILSPYLAIARGTHPELRPERMIVRRSEQLYELLKENVQLNVSIKEAELRSAGRDKKGEPLSNGDAPHTRKRDSHP